MNNANNIPTVSDITDPNWDRPVAILTAAYWNGDESVIKAVEVWAELEGGQAVPRFRMPGAGADSAYDDFNGMFGGDMHSYWGACYLELRRKARAVMRKF